MLIASFQLLLNLDCLAQEAANPPLKTIEPYRLAITETKTTNIIFPKAIVSVDRGTSDILVQKAKGVENILQVKAANNKIAETNVTVVTADGKLSSFLLSYSPEPAVLNISVGKASQTGTITMSPESVNQAEVQSLASSVAASKRKSPRIRDKNSGVSLKIDGIFIHEEILYWRVSIANESIISYSIDQLRFFIIDQKKAKRTATQEIEVSPAYVFNNTEKVAAGDLKTIVFAVPKFTIPDDKILAVQLMEKNGGRHIAIEVKNRHLMRAIPIQASKRP